MSNNKTKLMPTEKATLVWKYWFRNIMKTYESISIEDIAKIIVEYCNEWSFHMIDKCTKMTISENGLSVVYPYADAYRPLYFGYPLSTTHAKKFTIDIKFNNVQNINSIGFIEDKELEQEQWCIGAWVNLIKQKQIPAIRYKGAHYHWRGDKMNKYVTFNGSGDVVQVCMDLNMNIATITNLKRENVISVLDGITKHTRLAIFPLRTDITVTNYVFEY
eukprot:347025_1